MNKSRSVARQLARASGERHIMPLSRIYFASDKACIQVIIAEIFYKIIMCTTDDFVKYTNNITLLHSAL